MSQTPSWGNIPAWSYEAVRSLLETLNTVEPMTYQHCLRVGEYSRKLARDLGLNEYQQKSAEFAGMLHDIGKIGIDREILLKPGRLDPKELDIMKNHSILSENIVKPLATNQFFSGILPAIRGHHERMDGEGYPDKKNGDEIPLIARVILIVDTFDAMSENRSYRKGLPTDVVFAELKRCSGTQFDAQMLKPFLKRNPIGKLSPTKKRSTKSLKKSLNQMSPVYS